MSGEVNLVTKLWRSGRELARAATDIAKAIERGDQVAVDAAIALLPSPAVDLALAAVRLATVSDPAQAAQWCNNASHDAMLAAMSGDETAEVALTAIWVIEVVTTVMTWAARNEPNSGDPATKLMAAEMAKDLALLAMTTAKAVAKPRPSGDK